MDAQKRKALRKAYGYCIERGATLPDRTDAIMAQLGIKSAAYYEQVLTRLVKTLYHGDIDLLQFTQLFGDLVEGQLTRAWDEGMVANGLDVAVDMTDEWQAELDKIILDEKINISGFADEIVQASGLTGEPLDQFLSRVDMWANRYDDVVNQATLATAEAKDKLVWVYGDTDHCPECEQLNGVVASAADWERAQVHPQQPPNDAMSCGGWRCQCHLDPTAERRSPNAYDKILAIVLGAGKSMKVAKVPPQLAEDPKDANGEWLKDNDPRIALFAKGHDPDGKLIKAYIVDGRKIRDNVFQDWCEGGNHSRYPWNPKHEYWLGESHIEELEYNLVHETVEDRKMQTGTEYSEAHSKTANPAEYKARHGDAKKALRDLGWDV